MLKKAERKRERERRARSAIMASKIQRLVSQARATFSKRGVEAAFSAGPS